MKDLLAPYYAAPDVLKVTGLKAETLQTWVNRRVIKLDTQNPGRGKRRLYSSIDVMKLAILRRTDDLGVALNVALDWAEGAANMLLELGSIDWNLYISHRPRNDPLNPIHSIAARGMLGDYFPKYYPKILDPTETHLSEFVEPRIGIVAERRDKRGLAELIEAQKALDFHMKNDPHGAVVRSLGRKPSHFSDEDRRSSNEEYQKLMEATVQRPMNTARREEMARMGFHCEPVIVFPLGEISNGVLAQLRGLDRERVDG